MTITENQLDRINHLRERVGSNPVTMQTAEILLDEMGQQGREDVMRRVGIDWDFNEVLKIAANEPKRDKSESPAIIESPLCAMVREAERGCGTFNVDDVVALIQDERERCAGVASNAIRDADKMLGVADAQWYRSALTAVLDGMDPSEGKYSLSREQDQKDAIAEALMNDRERCAKAVEALRGRDDAICSDCAELAARVIRSGE